MKSVLVLTVLLFGSASAPALTNKVLIIGIDGLMPSALAVAKTPNLEALKSNGCYSVRAVTHPVTHSAACWSSMFTGVWGDKHKVNDPGNSFAGNNFAKYPSFFARLEAANSNWNTVCLARWAPLLTVVPDADVQLAFNSDTAVTDETCKRLTNSNPDVFYTILLDVDSAGHTYGWGPTVPNYVKAIEAADSQVGRMTAALNARPTLAQENWLVIALSDHGEHDNPDPERSRITFHIVSGPAAARGVMWPSPAIVDVCATVLTHMGVLLDPSWELDARVEGLPLRPVAYGSNLLFNGDAEANSGTDRYATNRGIAWWFDIAETTLGRYGAAASFPSAASPGPAQRGSNFFLGGTKTGTISQRIDVTELAGDLDGSLVQYQLEGWFGGALAKADMAQLTVNFLSANGAVLGTGTIGGVTAAERAGVTGLVRRTGTGDVPAATRYCEFLLRTEAAAAGTNDASADNLGFVLSLRADVQVTITPVPALPGEFSVQFPSAAGWMYTLERSTDLRTWAESSPGTAGTGNTLMLTDSNAPAGAAFYRVRRWP